MKKKFPVLLMLLAGWGWGAAGYANTFTVTVSDDSGPGTLRQALTDANLLPGPHLVQFNLAGNSITVNASLPAIAVRVRLDGGGAQVLGMNNISNYQPIIHFVAGSEGSTLTGMALVDGGSPVLLEANCIRVTNCCVGTDWNGASDRPDYYGFWINSDANDIGGSTPAERNIICNCHGIGVYMSGHTNRVRGNYIGTTQGGTYALYCANGLDIQGTGNVVGGNRLAGEGNLISGNWAGIVLDSDGNTVCGNIIGLIPDQSSRLDNGTGVRVASNGNLIGLPAAGYENIIAGNTYYGIQFQNNATLNLVQNNYLGLSTSDVAWTNGTGISLLVSCDANQVGGNRSTLQRNIIAGNNTGVQLNSNGNTVCGNYFGTAHDGNSLVTNSIDMMVGGTGNLIGGRNVPAGPVLGNLLCGNGGIGVWLEATASAARVFGNQFGVLANGQPAPSVYGNAIYLTDGSHDNFVGSKVLTDNNLIANSGTGIFANGTGAVNNGFFGNTICAFTSDGIWIQSGANLSKAAPVITSMNGTISGTAAAGDYVELFTAENGTGHGGSLSWIGSATANGLGFWSCTPGGGPYTFICATATDASNNTSKFSANFTAPTPTSTSTVTPTATRTPTASPTSSATPSVSATVSATPTVTPSRTTSATATASVTPSSSSTLTPSSTATPTPTASPAYSPTFTPTPSTTSTASPSVTATGGNTASTGTPTFTPAAFDMHGKAVLAFPNPGRDHVTFLFNLPESGEVTITLYDLAGWRAAKLSANLPAGEQALVWNCAQAAPGIYIARINVAGQDAHTLKIAIVR
jgi:hypothetical protein